MIAACCLSCTDWISVIRFRRERSAHSVLLLNSCMQQRYHQQQQPLRQMRRCSPRQRFKNCKPDASFRRDVRTTGNRRRQPMGPTGFRQPMGPTGFDGSSASQRDQSSDAAGTGCRRSLIFERFGAPIVPAISNRDCLES